MKKKLLKKVDFLKLSFTWTFRTSGTFLNWESNTQKLIVIVVWVVWPSPIFVICFSRSFNLSPLISLFYFSSIGEKRGVTWRVNKIWDELRELRMVVNTRKIQTSHAYSRAMRYTCWIEDDKKRNLRTVKIFVNVVYEIEKLVRAWA